MSESPETKLTKEEIEIARKYDLTKKVVPFLDRQLVYFLVESCDYYDEEVVLKFTYDLLEDTNLVSFLKSQYSALNPGKPLPPALVAKEEFVENELARFEKETSELLSVLADKDVQEHLKQDKHYNRQYLEREHNITEQKINSLYEFAQFQYSRGNYMMTSDLLNNFRIFSTDIDSIVSATWGKLASDIISLQWDSCLQELSKLKEVIDSHSFQDPLVQLHNRTWIIHWSLFPFFHAKNGMTQLVDLFFSNSYLSTIQAACPWILRYLVAAVVSSYSRSSFSSTNFPKKFKELVRVVGQEQYEYNDPLTDFIKALYIDYNFEEARQKLSEASVIIKTDSFLKYGATSFLENARYLISEVYCRVHQRIDLAQLSNYLNMSKEDGEKWIAKLIRDTKMNAKIDESEGTVIMNHPVTSVYQEVIEKTKGLTYRSSQLLSSVAEKAE